MPTGVGVLAGLMMVGGTLFVIAGVALLFLGPKTGSAASAERGGLGALWVGVGAAAGVIFLAFGGLHAILAFGLLKLRNVARVLTMFLLAISAADACLGLVATLVRFTDIALVWKASVMIADLGAVWYLLHPRTKEVFGA